MNKEFGRAVSICVDVESQDVTDVLYAFDKTTTERKWLRVENQWPSSKIKCGN